MEIASSVNDELWLRDGSWPEHEPWLYDIVHTTLERAPPFQTTSYVWGDDPREHHPTLSTGEIVMINTNLIKAIPRLSSRCDTGYLWIDQVCINQDSIAERNQQVKIMGCIYRAGQEVLIWFGGPSSLLLERSWADLFNSSPEITKIRQLNMMFETANSSLRSGDSTDCLQAKLKKCSDDSTSVVALDVLNNPEFSRA